MLFLIMSGNGYKLYLQNFSSALLANHLFSRGDSTTYATVSSPYAVKADHALSHLVKSKHANYKEGFTYLWSSWHS